MQGGGLPAAASPTVRLQGVAASEAVNDVVIEVAHTTADGADTDTAMIELTVILATLTFRPENPLAQPREVWSANNEVDATPLAPIGAPTLGFIRPGAPEASVGFFKGMEIRAEVEPCIDGLLCEFDFKRERQGRAGLLFSTQQGGLAFSPIDFDCPAPNWCDDDLPVDPNDPSSINEDEDLSTAPPDDCDLFSIDNPGIATAGLTCAQLDGLAQQVGAASFAAAVNAMDFREWLEVDGIRVSPTVKWHAATEVGCPDGMLVETNDEFGNALGMGHAFGGAPEGAEQAQGRRWGEPDVIEGAVELRQALDACKPTMGRFNGVAFSRLWSNVDRIAADVQQRRIAVQELIDIAERSELELAVASLSPRVQAIDLLGRLRAQKASSVLVKLTGLSIRDPFCGTVTGTRLPARDALVRIGAPAVGDILEDFGTRDMGRWMAMHSALGQIDRRTPAVRQAMRALLEAQADFPAPENEEEAERRERVKQRLEQFLETPEPDRSEPEPGQIAARPRLAGGSAGATRE